MKSSVVFISGLAPTSDYNGFKEYADKLELLFPDFTFALRHYEDVINQDYDYIFGHSYGGHTAVKLAERSIKKVKGVFLIEPVYQGWYWPWNWSASSKSFVITVNVLRAVCFIRKGARVPVSMPIQNESLIYTNDFIEGLDHATAPRSEYIQTEMTRILNEITAEAVPTSVN